jgi:hypothetical protein
MELNRRDLMTFTGLGILAGISGGIRSALGLDVPKVPIQREFVGPQEKTTQSEWVHGTIVEAEAPENLASNGIRRYGWGTTFHGKSGSTNWFHIPITTPVLIDDHAPDLVKVYVFYKATGATITSVHVYDGPRQVKSFDGLRLTGDQSGQPTPANSWEIKPQITIAHGLGITVGVQFSTYFDSTPPLPPLEILFTTAGADFVKTVPVLSKR